MDKMVSFIILLVGISWYHAQNQDNVLFVKYEELEKKIQAEGDKLLVVNFWSTTCAPCVKELPFFMGVNNKYKNDPKFKMILVSLDRALDKDRVLKFIKNKNLTAEVILLDDIKRMNTWIPRFEKDWDGNIPVTIFYKNGEKIHFNDGEMNKEELENTITKYLN